MNNKKVTWKDEKCAFDDGALYIILYKEIFANGTYKIHHAHRHAFSIEQAYNNFLEECKYKGIDFELFRIFQAYESRKYFYQASPQ